MLRERTRLESELTDLGLQVASGHRSLRESFYPKSLPELEYQITPAATTYDNALTYAINKLKDTRFGLPAELGGRFDSYYWEKKLDPFYRNYRGNRYHMLVLLPDKSPSIAIKQIVENNRAWSLDCAYFVQVAHLYAVSQSDPHFDNRWAGKEFRLRVHFSSGAGVDQIKYYFKRKTKSAPWMVTKDGKWQWERSNWGTRQILDAMRRGSRVMWTNDKVRPHERDLNRLAFRNENTVKIGNDRYLPFPIFSRPLSETKIRLILADYDLGRGRRTGIADARDDADARRFAGRELQNHADRYVFLKEALCFRRP